MTDDVPANRVFVSARTTQDFVIDKTALAERLQFLMEKTLWVPAVKKQLIEGGNAIYTLDYATYAAMCEDIYTHAITQNINGGAAKPSLVGLTDVRIEGQGKDTTLHVTVNLDHIIAALQKGGVVTGRDPSVPVPSKHEALLNLTSLFTLNTKDVSIDGQQLLATIQALVGGQLKADMNFSEKQQIRNQLTEGMRISHKAIPAIQVHRRNEKVHMTFPFDAVFQTFEQQIPEALKSAIMIRRTEDGKAIIRIDYTQIVDIAVHKAQKALDKNPQGLSKITHLPPDQFQLTLSKGNLENILNGLLDTGIQMAGQQIEAQMPEGIHIKRIADQPINRRGQN